MEQKNKMKAVISTYNPDLVYTKGFSISSVFVCSSEMNNYVGDINYHSLMHRVQKPMLTANKVKELSFFANKLLLREWTQGLILIQKTFGFSSTLSDDSEIQRLFQIVISKVENLEEFIIKPSNGSESIATLKVYRYKGELKAQFLCKNKDNLEKIDGYKVITDYKTFKHWISKKILNITSGDIDTHLRHIEPGLIIQELFPHDKEQKGPIEMKYFTAWGELLFVGCRNGKGVYLGTGGEYLEGDLETAHILQNNFFLKLKKTALSLARASTFPNLRMDFFVDIKSGKWVLNEIETLADCRSYPDYILENTGNFFLKGWIDKKYITFDSLLTVPVLRDRLKNELMK